MTSPALWQIEGGNGDGVALIVNVPHAGTYLPPAIALRLTAAGMTVPDTDWYVDRLYDFVPSLGATLMVATHSRIVVDLNRDPSGLEMYPGASNTEICPTSTFHDEPVYKTGMEPDAAVIRSRIEQYWLPYHAQLTAEIERIKHRHGYCILLDGHSIVSMAPRFFAGRLPDLSLGTADGNSCAASLAQTAFAGLAGAGGFSAVHNGRFKGGHITRHYGKPTNKVHALQLEMAQCCYMDEAAPHNYDERRADTLRTLLKRLVGKLVDWRPMIGDEAQTKEQC
ncbi:MAG: N-formylglutamate deformylase [Betaproteobacteria bacterium]